MSDNHAHYPALDGVRGIAILMVLLAHTHPKFLDSGFIGVDLFFVLSGFLITSILLGEYLALGSISLSRFYIRRALRLFPALFAMVTVITLYTAIFHRDELMMTMENGRAIIFYYWNWILYANYQQNGWTYQWVFGHLWSLSVEEQFYIVWPCVLLLAMSRKLLLPLILAFGICTPAIARLFLDAPSFNLYFRTDLHCDGLVWGALGACIVALHWLPKSDHIARILPVAGTLGLAGFIFASFFELFWSGFAFFGGWSLLDCLAMIAIVSLVVAPLPVFKAAMNFSPLRWTGRISYGLYIWHLPVFFYCRNLPVNEPSQSLIAIVLSYTIATISFYGMERYFLRLKDRFSAATIQNSIAVHEMFSIEAVAVLAEKPKSSQ